MFYAPNGDTVVLQDAETSDSSSTDTEHLARNAISGLMNLISEDGGSLSKPVRTRSTRRYANEHRQDISMDECIDLSKPGGVLLTDRNSLESRYRLYNQQRVLRPVLDQSTGYPSKHARE